VIGPSPEFYSLGLEPGNILLKGKLEVKIGDFGCN
jgi:hypothetical protein